MALLSRASLSPPVDLRSPEATHTPIGVRLVRTHGRSRPLARLPTSFVRVSKRLRRFFIYRGLAVGLFARQPPGHATKPMALEAPIGQLKHATTAVRTVTFGHCNYFSSRFCQTPAPPRLYARRIPGKLTPPTSVDVVTQLAPRSVALALMVSAGKNTSKSAHGPQIFCISLFDPETGISRFLVKRRLDRRTDLPDRSLFICRFSLDNRVALGYTFY